MEIKGKKNEVEPKPAILDRQGKVGVALGHNRGELPAVGPREAGEDKVELSLGRMIHETLDPVKMAAERRHRVAEIRQAWQEGRLTHSSHLVARAVGEELTMEILTNRVISAPDGKDGVDEEQDGEE